MAVLTKSAIDKLKGPTQVQDTLVPGLGVKVTGDQKKTFVLRYTFNGKRQLRKLGDYGVMTLEMARDCAREKLLCLGTGQDPFVEQRSNLTPLTWNQFWPDYERLVGSKKKSLAHSRIQYNKHVRDSIGMKAIAETKRSDIGALKLRMADTPIAFNHVRSLLSVMWQAAIESLPDETTNPVRDVKKYPSPERTRFFSPDEIEKIEATALLHQASDEFAPFIVRLYLLTGLRHRELLSLQWKDVDLKNASLIARDTKNGTDHHLPLHEEAVAVFKDLPRNPFNPNVFPGPGGKGQRKSFRSRWDRIAKDAGIEDAHIHDLRRTFGARLIMAGVKMQVVSRLLNHKNMATTQKHYAKLSNIQDTEMRDGMIAYVEKLNSALA